MTIRTHFPELTTFRLARWFRSGREARTGGRRHDPRSRRPKPYSLHEALAIGLGCDSYDRKAPLLPEWR